MWRLILHDEGAADWNMAVDEAILDAVEGGLVPPTLRLYRWDRPAVSLGRFQSAERGLNLAACDQLDIEIVRRPTGGRGILHGGDQTMSIVAPVVRVGDSSRIADLYAVLASGLPIAFSHFGVTSRQADAGGRSGRGGDCFASTSAADIVSDAGDKLAGCALRRRSGHALMQASIRHLPGSIDSAQVFRGAAPPPVYRLSGVSEEELRDAIARGYERALGIRLKPGVLSMWELERAGTLVSLLRQARSVDRARGL